MNPSDCYEKIAALRTQIQKDSGLDVQRYEQHLATALSLLDELAASGLMSHRALLQISQLKNSLREFYSPDSTRGWAQRFVLNDLKVLEELSGAQPRSRDSDSQIAA